MKFTKFEKFVMFAVVISFFQLSFGYVQYAIHGMLVLILVVLMGILEYVKPR